MAKIYAPPKSIKKPKFDFTDVQGSLKAEEKYVEELIGKLKKYHKGKNVGEIIRFQVADGYAQYIIASMRPLELVHVDTGDGYQFEYAHLLNETEVRKKLKQQEAMAKIFGKR